MRHTDENSFQDLTASKLLRRTERALEQNDAFHVRMYVCTYQVHLFVPMYQHAYVCTFVYTYIHMYVPIYIHMYVHVCIYTGTYVYINTLIYR
jgi:hypothetical protein